MGTKLVTDNFYGFRLVDFFDMNKVKKIYSNEDAFYDDVINGREDGGMGCEISNEMLEKLFDIYGKDEMFYDERKNA